MPGLAATPAARLVLLAAAALLALPVAVGFAVLDEGALARFYRRPLSEPPGPAMLLHDPAGMPRAITRHLSDRTWGVLESAALMQRLRHEVLGDPGTEMLVRDGDFVFLKRHDDNAHHAFDAIAGSCRIAEGDHVPDWPDRLVENTRRLHVELARPGRRVAFLAVPSKPVLYHDRLPEAVPAWIRGLCNISALHNAELGGWASRLAEDGIVAQYPLGPMRANRDRRAFYPPQNYHAEGAGAHVATWSLLNRLYGPQYRPQDVPLRIERGQADMRQMLSYPRMIEFLRPDYAPRWPVRDAAREAELRASWPLLRDPWVWRVNAGQEGAAGRRLVVIGNSFAQHATRNLAVAFSETVLVNDNLLTPDGRRLALGPLLDALEPDLVVFLFQDASVKSLRFRQFLEVL